MYDMGKLNTSATSSENIKRIFGHKFTEILKMIAFSVSLCIALYKVDVTLIIIVLTPIGLNILS